MLEHPLSPTTRTVELAQLAELDAALKGPDAPHLTASDLGLTEDAYRRGEPMGGLPPSSVLLRLCWDGPPEYPYIHGHFSAGSGGSEAYHVDLHTAALNELSHRLHLHHRWGV